MLELHPVWDVWIKIGSRKSRNSVPVFLRSAVSSTEKGDVRLYGKIKKKKTKKGRNMRL